MKYGKMLAAAVESNPVISLSDLSRTIKKSRTYISNIKKGTSLPTVAQHRLFVDILDLDDSMAWRLDEQLFKERLSRANLSDNLALLNERSVRVKKEFRHLTSPSQLIPIYDWPTQRLFPPFLHEGDAPFITISDIDNNGFFATHYPEPKGNVVSIGKNDIVIVDPAPVMFQKDDYVLVLADDRVRIFVVKGVSGMTLDLLGNTQCMVLDLAVDRDLLVGKVTFSVLRY